MQYIPKRASEYPSIVDQLDDLYHNGIYTSVRRLMFWSAQKSFVMGMQLKYLHTSQSCIGVT